MTPYQAKFVAHIIQLAKLDRIYANWAILEFQRLDPYQLKNLKAMVMAEVLRSKSEHTRLYSPHNNQYTKGRKRGEKCGT